MFEAWFFLKVLSTLQYFQLHFMVDTSLLLFNFVHVSNTYIKESVRMHTDLRQHTCESSIVAYKSWTCTFFKCLITNYRKLFIVVAFFNNAKTWGQLPQYGDVCAAKVFTQVKSHKCYPGESETVFNVCPSKLLKVEAYLRKQVHCFLNGQAKAWGIITS